MKLGFDTGVLMRGDCLDLMQGLPDASVDMILCDLPYGTTQNKWDSVIPFEALWREYWRIAKPAAPVVLTAAQPFTSAAVMSQLRYFKYDWTWRKLGKATGHLNARKQPLRDKEDILVFYRQQATYNPQMGVGTPYKDKAGKDYGSRSSTTDNYGSYTNVRNDNEGTRCPKQVLEFSRTERGNISPTQKPEALFEYLIRTYTNPGDLVLDNCIGSGTTAVAAINTGRGWIGMEQDEGYFAKAADRILDSENKRRAKA